MRPFSALFGGLFFAIPPCSNCTSSPRRIGDWEGKVSFQIFILTHGSPIIWGAIYKLENLGFDTFADLECLRQVNAITQQRAQSLTFQENVLLKYFETGAILMNSRHLLNRRLWFNLESFLPPVSPIREKNIVSKSSFNTKTLKYAKHLGKCNTTATWGKESYNCSFASDSSRQYRIHFHMCSSKEIVGAIVLVCVGLNYY